MYTNVRPKGAFDDLPMRARKDPMAPPAKAVTVKCLHCGREYSSEEIVWFHGMWCCPHESCRGTGFLFDLFPMGKEEEEGR